MTSKENEADAVAHSRRLHSTRFARSWQAVGEKLEGSPEAPARKAGESNVLSDQRESKDCFGSLMAGQGQKLEGSPEFPVRKTGESNVLSDQRESKGHESRAHLADVHS